ncbi:Zinc finger, PHD-type [Fusarium oxysporum f. sp. vasinfectum]|nr:Zinc finger, PHD-type [Fusarium oxysporum f. sp. vasinfectum]
MEQTIPTIGQSEDSRSEPVENDTKSETVAGSTPQPPSDAHPASSNSPSHPPSTSAELYNMAAHTASKKKGTASAVKKTPKRSKKTGGPRAAKRAKPARSGSTGDAHESAGSELEESDHGPYCLCRGADDHRWMICCENCEDWFHGECINMNKEIGENLIEKFICPLCTNENLTTLYKKTCALGGCKKAAPIAQEEKSVFCSNEHAQTWWERMVAKLPKAKGKGGVNDQLTQEEFMALLQGGLSGTDEEGLWRLVKAPFAGTESNGTNGTEKENPDQMHLSAEEKEYLENAAAARFHLAEETVLCHKMLTLLEFAHERRQAAITAGRFKEDICGYDQRLDSISARDAFEAFAKSPEGEAIFKASQLSDPLGEGDEVRGMCERKRCKIHSGWYKMLSLGLKHQIREMATQADEVGEEEKAMRQAAKDRWRRKQSEKNWVEVLDG